MIPSKAHRARYWLVSAGLGTALLGACASSGTEPQAMTAGQHETVASAEEQAAAVHQNRPSGKRPSALNPRSNGAGSACLSYDTSDCSIRWRSTENPTDRHRNDSERHRKLAEKHRAASQALREAEQHSCSGISAADRDLSPFYHRDDITAVEAVKKPVRSSYGYGYDNRPSVVQVQPIEKEVLGPGGLLGARITFRAVPGMTGEWLQRVVDCHVARNSLGGAADPSVAFCPLAVPHVAAKVSSTGTGFAVDVTSDAEDSATEIVKRAQALGPIGPAVMK